MRCLTETVNISELQIWMDIQILQKKQIEESYYDTFVKTSYFAKVAYSIECMSRKKSFQVSILGYFYLIIVGKCANTTRAIRKNIIVSLVLHMTSAKNSSSNSPIIAAVFIPLHREKSKIEHQLILNLLFTYTSKSVRCEAFSNTSEYKTHT